MSEFDIVHDTPIEQLPNLLPSLTPDQRVAAKARIKATRKASFEAEKDRLLEKQRPKNMGRPFALKIKEWRSDPVCGSIFLVPSRIPGSRKLAAGEIIILDLDDDVVRDNMAWGHLEIVDEPPTRPLIYPHTEWAKVTDPRASRLNKFQPAYVAKVQSEVAKLCRELYNELVQVQRENDDAERAERAAPPEMLSQLQQQRIEKELASEKNAEDPPKATFETGEDDGTGLARRRRPVQK